MAVFVGIYDDHNSGFAAVTEDGVVLYSEFERMTRAKNQAGWHPDLVADCLNTIGLEDLAAITAPDVSKVAGLLAERYEAEIINGDAVVLGGRRIRLLPQADLHPTFHVLACTTIPLAGPGVYIAVVFDAEQPRFTWIDLRDPLTAPPELQFLTVSDDAWFNGAIFADFYGAIFYGNGDLSNCGKLMGLSGWGRTRLRHTRFLEAAARRHFDESVETWNGYRWLSAEAVRTDVHSYLHVSPREHKDPDVLDLATSAQQLFTDSLMRQAEQALPLLLAQIAEAQLPAPIGVLYGGGCALSVVSNCELRESIGLPVFIPPFAHDASQFVGGAIWAGLSSGMQWTPGRGWPSTPQQTGGSINNHTLLQHGAVGTAASPAAVAKLLTDGQLVGLANHGAEAGPRALGMRSILASATDRSIRDRINHQVKKREWYRPFAPALAASDFSRYFGAEASPAATYMLDAFRVRPELRDLLHAVSGPDGVSRPQAVSGDMPFLSEICAELGALTGHPIVLNTSLNAPGMTIANGLDQVLADSATLGLDHLVVDDIMLNRHEIRQLAQRKGW